MLSPARKELAEFVSRKFILTAACLVGGFIVVFTGKDAYGYAAIISPILAFYSGANVLQDYVNAKYTKPAPMPHPQQQYHYGGNYYDNTIPSYRHYPPDDTGEGRPDSP